MRMKLSILIIAGCVASVWPCVAIACTMTVSPIEVGTQFQVSVTDRGRPVSGLRVVLSPAVFPPDNPDAGKIYSTTDSEGIAHFSDLSPGSLYVSAQYDGGESLGLVIDISPGTHIGATVQMSWPSRTPIVVRTASGILRTNSFYPSRDQNSFSLELIEGISGHVVDAATSDSKGRFSFKVDVPPGIYFLRVDPSGIRASDGEQIEGAIPIELRADADHDSLDLELGWTSCGLTYAQRESEPDLKVDKICGDIADPEGGAIGRAQIFLMDAEDNSKILDQVASDPNGKFAFEEENNRSYEMIIKSPGFRTSVRVVHLIRGSPSAACAKPIHVRLGVL